MWKKMTVPNTEKSVFTVKKESVSRKEFIKKKKNHFRNDNFKKD